MFNSRLDRKTFWQLTLQSTQALASGHVRYSTDGV
jgi:hypothetical protein